MASEREADLKRARELHPDHECGYGYQRPCGGCNRIADALRDAREQALAELRGSVQEVLRRLGEPGVRRYLEAWAATDIARMPIRDQALLAILRLLEPSKETTDATS